MGTRKKEGRRSEVSFVPSKEKTGPSSFADLPLEEHILNLLRGHTIQSSLRRQESRAVEGR